MPPSGVSSIEQLAFHRPHEARGRPRARGRRRCRRRSPSRWNGWNTCSRSAGVMPGPWSMTRRSTRSCTRPAVTRAGRSSGDHRIAFSTRFATTRSSSAASARTGLERLGHVDHARRRRARRGSRSPPARPPRGSPAAASGCSAPACSRLMSSRFDTSAVSRSVSSSIVSRNAASSCRRPLDVGLAQARRRRLDRRERRAQVVRHRLRATRCAARWPRSARSACAAAAASRRALARRGELRGERVEHLAVGARQPPPASASTTPSPSGSVRSRVARATPAASNPPRLDAPRGIVVAVSREHARAVETERRPDEHDEVGERIVVLHVGREPRQRLGVGAGPGRVAGAARRRRRRTRSRRRRPRGTRSARARSRAPRSSSCGAAA